MGFDFYLGVHRPAWMPLTDVPLFISAVILRRRRTIPKARARMGFDSGGFSELDTHGTWTVDDRQHAALVTRVLDAGNVVDFAAVRDWMCEPFIREKTGKTISEHQKLTIDSYATLRAIAPKVPWLPVLQGWHPDDYEQHFDMYAAAGFDLRKLPRVGVGSVCRRQATKDGAAVMNRVADLGVRAHAFGIKVEGLKLFGHRIASADSMTWSAIARERRMNLSTCLVRGHRTARGEGSDAKNCGNCLRWALEWHSTRILGRAPTARRRAGHRPIHRAGRRGCDPRQRRGLGHFVVPAHAGRLELRRRCDSRPRARSRARGPA